MTAYRIQDYRMEYVYLRITEAQRQEVMALWQSTQIVPDAAERERRSHEVVILVYSPQSELAGLSSVAGPIIVAENRKLMRPGTQRELKRLGFHKWGLSHKGEEI